MLAIGCDPAGFLLKQEIIKFLTEQGVPFQDIGCFEGERTDYPVVAQSVCKKILSGEADKGLLICGTGIGMSMAANKIKGIRACACSDYYSAKYTRLHNDANVLCLGGRVIGPEHAKELVKVFLETPFEGGRHQRRVDMLTELENQ